MKLIPQLGFLRLPWDPKKDEVEDDRLVHLFRNRAELKKAYSGVQDEVQRLKDRIKQQEGATARVQEMLQALEARLSETATAYPTLVFYQLRELWALGRTLLTQFVAELAEQQEERERRAFLAEYNRRQFDRRQGIDANLRLAESRAADARAVVSDIEQRIQALRQFWHYFKRRSLRQRLQEANLHALLCVQDLESARAARAALDAETPPEFAGLSVEARRAINLAAVAYAQSLCDRLAPTGLVEPARVAAGRREPPRDDYGDRARCEATMAEIVRARALLEQRGQLSQEIKQRSDRFQELANYRKDGDTVPVAESLSATVDGSKALNDDMWEIYRTLLR
ncbi:MAG TPA: hypothetical protein VGH84_15690 [Steroidobacteraceae bacterium]|jgi:hypothetical protein